MQNSVRTRINALIAGLLTAIATCGCASPSPDPQGAVVGQPPPVFANSHHALSAATAAMTSYLAANDQISRAGGADLESLSELVTEDQYTRERESFARLSADGGRQIGSVNLLDSRLQQHFEAEGLATVIAYFCLDFSGISMLRNSDTDTSAAFQRPATFVAEFTSSPDAPNQLLLASNELAQGDPACE